MARLYRVFRGVLRVIGSRWGFWPVALVALFANGMHGRPLDAVPFLAVWGVIVAACGWVGRLLPSAPEPFLPHNPPMPPSAIAVNLTRAAPIEASPDLDTMRARLPPAVERLLK